MVITQALKTAPTEHVVYFLLTAYVETLCYADPYGIPEKLKRLPVTCKKDVHERSMFLNQTLSARMSRDTSSTQIIKEAREVFDTAGKRLERI